MSCTRALAIASVLALASAPAFAATAVSGQVNGNASAFLGNDRSLQPATIDSHGAQTSGLPGTLVGFGNAAAALGTDNAIVANGVTGTWANDNAGSFVSSNSWATHTPDPAIAIMQVTTIDQSLNRSGPAWSYVFDATGNDDLFSMNFDVSITGDAIGLGAWDILVLQDGQSIGFHTLSNGAGPGSFTQALSAGHRYQINLTSNDGLTLFGNAPGHNFVGDAESRFAWAITGSAAPGVPEPGTWAMALVGFGLAGTALRRKPRHAFA